MCDVIRCGYVNFNFVNSQNSKKEFVEELCKHIKVFLVHFEVVCWTGKFKENFCGHFAFKEIIVTKMFSSGKCIELENVKKIVSFCIVEVEVFLWKLILNHIMVLGCFWIRLLENWSGYIRWLWHGMLTQNLKSWFLFDFFK